MKIATALLFSTFFAFMIFSLEACTATFYYGLSNKAFDALVQEKFDALSPDAREFESKVEKEYERNNKDHMGTQMGIMGLVGETRDKNMDLYNEIAIVLAALGRNKLRHKNGSRRI